MDQGSSLGFNFNSQAGVMSLLATIRSSSLSPSDKNELRDLVFLYKNGGGDASVRIALEQKLAAHNLISTLSSTSQVVQSAQDLSFGTSRPAPVFGAVTNQTPIQPQAVAQPQYVPPQPVVPPQPQYVAPTPQPVAAQPQYVPPQPVVPPTPQPASVASQYVPPVVTQNIPVYAYPAPQPAVAQPQYVSPAPQPVAAQPQYVPPQPVVPPQPQYVAPAPLPAQDAPTQNPTPAQPQMSAGGQNYLDRIREIKLAVNTKVGNPVNLVDIDNVVGREYMNALLDAMKRLSGGAPGQIEEAMQRLEAAYKSVEVAVSTHAQSQSQNQAAPNQSRPEPVPNQSKPELVNDVPSQQENVATSNELPPPIASPVILDDSEVIKSAEEEVSGFALAAEKEAREEALKAILPVPKPPSINNDGQKLQTPNDLPLASSLATSDSADPLKTREVDDGLNQLLSDWSLFKKSGLFGTGPKGREHPLFKKLADLQIPLLLAGRFEGSTQEIKQSITDYMNGWRYEQGIIYEQGETFEHYLRRVIKQILDLQRKHKPA